MLGFDLLNKRFPKWYKNKYLKTLPGLKNKYFKIVRRWNIMFLAWFCRNFYKITI